MVSHYSSLCCIKDNGQGFSVEGEITGQVCGALGAKNFCLGEIHPGYSCLAMGGHGVGKGDRVEVYDVEDRFR